MVKLNYHRNEPGVFVFTKNFVVWQQKKVLTKTCQLIEMA